MHLVIHDLYCTHDYVGNHQRQSVSSDGILFLIVTFPFLFNKDVNETKKKRKIISIAFLAVTIIFNNNTGMRLTGFGISSSDKDYSVF
jgi:hypothetical protein